jgi:hypothetical protein
MLFLISLKALCYEHCKVLYVIAGSCVVIK